MNKDQKDQNVLYSIANIRQILFSANESLITKPTEVVISSLNAKTGFNYERKLLNFTLRAWYHYKDESVELAVTEVENIFYIANIENFLNEDNELNFPSNLWVNIVGMSISHTRALFTRSLAGTAFQDIMIGIMNPYDTAKHFYPTSFEKEVQSTEPILSKKKARKVYKK